MCSFIAQLVERRTGIAEVTGSNPVEALIFFRLLLSSYLNWKIHCEDHPSLPSITAVQIYELFHIYLHHFTPHGKILYELNKLTSLPMCSFIAQLVERRTGIAEVTGSNPVEALIFFRLLLSSYLNWKIHCEDHPSLSSITAVQIYELFHIYLHQSKYCTYTNNMSAAFQSKTSSLSSRVSFSFHSALQSPLVKLNLNGLFYFPHILING